MQGELIGRVFALLGNVIRPLVYAALVLPAIIVVGASFAAGEALSFPPEGFSLRWYAAAFRHEAFMAAVWESVKLACVATVASVALGLAATFALDRKTFPGREAFKSLALSPLIVPMVVLGLGLLQFLAWMRLNQTFIGLLAGHTLICIPYVVRTLSASMILFDRTLEEAAANLRASPGRVLFKVTLPLLAPALVSASVFAFVTSFGNITLSAFLSFSSAIALPVQIFAYVEHSNDPVLAAVSTIVIIVTLIVIGVVEKLVGLEKIT